MTVATSNSKGNEHHLMQLPRCFTAAYVVIALCGCASHEPERQISDVHTTTSDSQAIDHGLRPDGTVILLPMPPTSLIPEAEGRPLPPRDLKIADHWPPDFKQLIDNMLSLFPKDGRPPSTKEVEEKMGVTLTERPLRAGEFYNREKVYVVSGTRYMDPNLGVPEGSDLKEGYWIDKGRYSGGQQRQSLTLVISPKQSGFCLNPYELAVYTGIAFINGDTTAHANVRAWPPAYVWGMFGWSNTGRYIGQGFSIAVGVGRDVGSGQINRIGCVYAISVYGRYQGSQ